MSEEDLESLADLLDSMGLSDTDLDAMSGMSLELVEDTPVLPPVSDEVLDYVIALGEDIEMDPDYEATKEVCGPQVATAYVLAQSCIFSLQETGEDNLLEHIVREAFGAMSSKAQAELCEKGL